MLLNLRSLTIEKLNDDGQPEGERPLGLGECELRFFCKVAVQQIKEKTQAHFTNAPAVDTARHAATVANAESAARRLHAGNGRAEVRGHLVRVGGLGPSPRRPALLALEGPPCLVATLRGKSERSAHN